MAVSFVLGNNHSISPSLLAAASTITVSLANEFSEADTEVYISSLYALALILFVISALLRAAAKYILQTNPRKDR
jgi:phosphate transport system permease protein